MADEQKPQDGQVPPQQKPPGGQEPPKPEGQESSEKTAEQREIERLRRENAGFRTKLKAQEEATQKATEEDAKKRGEYERLFNDERAKSTSLEAELATLRVAQQEELEAATAGWAPEDVETFLKPIPDVTSKLRLAKAINAKTQPAAQAANQPGMRPGTGKTFGGFNSLDEWASKDPKGYLEAKKQAKP